MSVQTTRYQKVSVPPVEGAANVCATELSPLNGELLPTRAAQEPVCAVDETPALPVLVHPERLPVSNPPFVMTDGGGGGGGGGAAPMATSS